MHGTMNLKKYILPALPSFNESLQVTDSGGISNVF
jgi:hypothetical protein